MITKEIDGLNSLGDVYQATNAGGMLEDVRLCPLEWFASTTSTSSVTASLTELKAGRFWVNFLAAHGTVNLSIKTNRTVNGVVFEMNLSLLMPKVNRRVLDWLMQHFSVDFVVMARDRNGNTILIGREFGVEIVNADIDYATKGGKNATKFEFVGISSMPPYEVSNEEDAASYATINTNNAVFVDANTALIERIVKLEGAVWHIQNGMFQLYRYKIGGGLEAGIVNIAITEPMSVDLGWVVSSASATRSVVDDYINKLSIRHLSFGGLSLYGEVLKVANSTDIDDFTNEIQFGNVPVLPNLVAVDPVMWTNGLDYRIQVNSAGARLYFRPDFVILGGEILQILVERKQ